MFNRITFNYDGIVTKGILLAEYEISENTPSLVKKKVLFFNIYKRTIMPKAIKYYLVFVPWKHASKEIINITEQMIISVEHCSSVEYINIKKYISKFVKESPYYAEHIVENFNGYKFIYEDNGFIANIINLAGDYALETLYKNMPELLNEEFDEDNAKKI